MSEFLTPEIVGLIQDGKLPLEIAKKVLNTDSDDLLTPGEKDDLEPETFPEEMVAMSQALAYRPADISDANIIKILLNKSYAPEVEGPESFRAAGDVISKEEIETSITENALTWIVVEVPEGRDTTDDGNIIAVCCYTSDGVSRRNGEVEGNLGSVRFFAVLPKYHGLCIGQRLLDKLEREMMKVNCVRMMFSVPSSRYGMQKWLEKRRFQLAGAMAYPPAIGHVLTVTETKLNIYLRPIEYPDLSKSMMEADSKNPKEIESTLTLNDCSTNSSGNVTGGQAQVEPVATTTFATKKRMNLPPHWRPEMYNKSSMSKKKQLQVQDFEIDEIAGGKDGGANTADSVCMRPDIPGVD